jgi:hypothetical protein
MAVQRNAGKSADLRDIGVILQACVGAIVGAIVGIAREIVAAQRRKPEW